MDNIDNLREMIAKYTKITGMAPEVIIMGSIPLGKLYELAKARGWDVPLQEFDGIPIFINDFTTPHSIYIGTMSMLHEN